MRSTQFRYRFGSAASHTHPYDAPEERSRKALAFLRSRIRETAVAPSLDELRIALGLSSKAPVHRLLKQLEAKGKIRRLPGRARAIEVAPDEVPAEIYPASPQKPVLDATKGYRYFRVCKVLPDDDVRLVEWRPPNHDEG
jgi:SOS-response transcriptional repressor LexA